MPAVRQIKNEKVSPCRSTSRALASAATRVPQSRLSRYAAQAGSCSRPNVNESVAAANRMVRSPCAKPLGCARRAGRNASACSRTHRRHPCAITQAPHTSEWQAAHCACAGRPQPAHSANRGNSAAMGRSVAPDAVGGLAAAPYREVESFLELFVFVPVPLEVDLAVPEPKLAGLGLCLIAKTTQPAPLGRRQTSLARLLVHPACGRHIGDGFGWSASFDPVHHAGRFSSTACARLSIFSDH